MTIQKINEIIKILNNYRDLLINTNDIVTTYGIDEKINRIDGCIKILEHLEVK